MILLTGFSVFCRRVSILLFEIPDELSCVGIAYGITNFIKPLIRGLKQLFCLFQLKFPKNFGKGRVGFLPKQEDSSMRMIRHISDMIVRRLV